MQMFFGPAVTFVSVIVNVGVLGHRLRGMHEEADDIKRGNLRWPLRLANLIGLILIAVSFFI